VHLPAAAIFFPCQGTSLDAALSTKRLSINILYASTGERQSKVLDRESRAIDRQALHNFFKDRYWRI
jgi:hypothetical protein